MAPRRASSAVYRISKEDNAMNQPINTLAEDTAIATGAFAQSTVVPIDNEPTVSSSRHSVDLRACCYDTGAQDLA